MQQTATSFKSFKHLASERVQLARTTRAPYPPRFLDSITLTIEVPFIFDCPDSIRSVFTSLFSRRNLLPRKAAIMPSWLPAAGFFDVRFTPESGHQSR